ncbi:MAG: HEAT repeat domain-containing protein [Leptolyngbyaceae cyanobacterium SM1_1_3]|nr:HEAT repeat domain-containing protein [Leptolyngbyaceae cyanobacterium SM1_1_3]
MRKRAAFALIKLGSDNALKAIRELKNKDLDTYRSVVFRNPDLEPNFSEFLRFLKNNESDSLHIAKEKLEEIGSAILGLLEESDHHVFKSTVDTSRRLVAEGITKEIKKLENPDEKVRRSAADTLGNSKAEEAIPALSKVLKEDSSWEVRRSAASALGQIGSKQVIPILLNVIESSDVLVAGDAAKALGQIDSDDTIPALLKALKSGNPEVRLIAAHSLSEFQSNCTALILPDLCQLLHTKSGEDAFDVIQAIQANCKFYNYEIAHNLIPPGKTLSPLHRLPPHRRTPTSPTRQPPYPAPIAKNHHHLEQEPNSSR